MDESFNKKFERLPNHDEKFINLLKLSKDQKSNYDVFKNPTWLDFFGVPVEIKEKDFDNLASGFFSEEKKEKKDFYMKLDESYQIGKKFLINRLGYEEEEINIGPDKIRDKKDLYALFKNSKLDQANHISYFRLIKATLIAHETLKKDFEQIAKISQDFKDRMMGKYFSANTAPFEVAETESKENIEFKLKSDPGIVGEMYSREKEIESAMMRYINRPESNAKKALEDGMGIRIMTTKENALKIIPDLCKWLIKYRKVRKLTLENKESFFEKELFDALKMQLVGVSEKPKNGSKLRIEKGVGSEENIEMIDEASSNPTASGKFHSFVIKGTISELEDENEVGTASVSRQFEVQFILPDNNNEEGFSNHSIYTATKVISARTRLDGSVPEAVFNKLIAEASRKSGKHERDIKRHFLNGSKEEATEPKVKIKKNKKKIIQFTKP